MRPSHGTAAGFALHGNGLPRYRVPAWLLSAALHAAVFVAAALLVRSPAAPPREPPLREVAIVLVERQGGAASFAADRGAADSAAAADKWEAEAAAALPDASSAQALAARLPLDLPEAADAAAHTAGDSPVARLVPSDGRRRAILPGAGDDAILAADPLLNAPPEEPAGPAITLTLFGGVKVAGNSFAFVIDRSKSMGGEGLGAIAAAERELRRELERLGPEHRFQIIAYNHARLPMSREGLLPATEENKRRAKEFLARIVAAGATEHEPALLAALRDKPDVVVLLTDGGEPPLAEYEIRTIVQAAGRTRITAIQFGHGPLQESDHFLGRLAARCGGMHAYVDMRQPTAAAAR